MRKLFRIFALSVSLIGSGAWGGNVYAVTCTSTGAGGNWNAIATWTGCAGGNGPVANTPGSNDTAVIATTGANVVTANVAITAGNVVINSGKLNVGGSNWTVNGTTTVNNSGTIDQTNTGGSATFSGLVTINSGGTWANTIGEAITFSGGITNNGIFNGGTGTQTFSATQTIGGASPINFGGIVAVANGVTVTNNNTNVVTITGNLTGGNASSTWVNAANSTLNYGGAAAPMGTRVFTANANPNMVNYTGAVQTVKATTYHDLTLSGSGAKTMGATTINGDFTLSGTATTAPTGALAVGGNFTIGLNNTFTAGAFTHSVGGNWSNSGTFNANTSTVTFNGAAAQALGGTATTTFNNLTINNASGVTLASSPTVSGTLTLTSGTFAVGGNTLTLNGPAIAGTPGNLSTTSSSSLSFGGTAAGVTVPGSVTALNNLTINNTSGVTLGGSSTLSGTLTLSAGAFAVGGNTLTLNGPAIAGAGASTNLLTTASSSLSFGGTAAGVTVPSSVALLNNLTINNTNGVALGGSSTLSGTLTLTSGTITTGANTLTLAASCLSSISRTSGYVIGNLQLTFPAGNNTCIYHVGDSIGYAPVTVAMVGATAGTLTGRADAGDHPDTVSSSSGIDAAKSANHYWTLTAGTLSTYTSYSATFQYCANTGSCVIPTELDAGANTGNFIVARKISGAWSMPTIGTRTAYSTQATGITSTNGFGEFALGEVNLCFSDSFAGVLGSNWSVGNKSGSFTPAIVSSRLRLTDTTNGQATWATLQRLFPAAGNKVTVEFEHFAYGGTGGDGMAVVFSDASVAPVAGAFGGSLGYAQKSNPGSDCVIVGGCPGFVGGWLGIALDEYGNFSNPTEGRYGGTGLVLDSVAIRGSGTGVSGYRFLQGTATLSPGIDGNNVPPGTVAYRYRFIIDHTDSVHAYVSVERDTTSGAGTAYMPLIAPFDVKDPGYSQSNIPTSFNLSFTGSTGASTNIHEIRNLSVCTVQPLAAPMLHHIQIDHGGNACASGTAPVTVKACADAGCTALYMGSVTVDLTPNAGGGRTWAPVEPVTFSGGSVAMTLANTTAGTVTLGGTAISPTTGNATQCFNGATQTCALVFSVCTFDVVEVGASPRTPIFTKLANVQFGLAVRNLSGLAVTPTAVRVIDASAGTCDGATPVLQATSTAMTSVPAGGAVTYNFTYNNVARNAKVQVVSAGPAYSCSYDNFAIRPQAFIVTSSASNSGNGGAPVFRAGTDPFSLTATAVYGATTTSGYTGIPRLNASLIFTNLAHLGTVASATFPAASSGVSTASGLKYDEAGNFNLAQYAVYDDAFAKVDSDKGECTPGFSNTLDANGKYSCQFGASAAGAFGRFVPDHFTVMGTVSNACAAGAFTYMGQSFTLSPAGVAQARNFANGVTANYAGAYAPGSVSFGAEDADNGIDLGGSLVFTGTGLPLSGTWAAGIFTLTGSATAVTFARPATPSGPFDQLNMGLAVTDADVATVPRVAGADFNPAAIGGAATYRSFAGSPLRMRFGRLKLSNAYGSELLNLPTPIQTQYWNGTSFVTNTADNCTSLAANNIKLTAPPAGVSATVGGAFLSGVGSLTLTKPATPATAAVNLCVDLGTDPVGGTVCSATLSANLLYLQGLWSPGASYNNDPAARATFGVYKGNSNFIYLRENY